MRSGIKGVFAKFFCTVMDKILYQYQIFDHDRFLLQMSVGRVPHEKILRSIEMFANDVAPADRKEVEIVH